MSDAESKDRCSQPPSPAAGEYQCSRCKKIYQYAWSEAEATAECKEVFGADPGPGTDVLCDDCYNAFMGWYSKTYGASA